MLALSRVMIWLSWALVRLLPMTVTVAAMIFQRLAFSLMLPAWYWCVLDKPCHASVDKECSRYFSLQSKCRFCSLHSEATERRGLWIQAFLHNTSLVAFFAISKTSKSELALQNKILPRYSHWLLSLNQLHCKMYVYLPLFKKYTLIYFLDWDSTQSYFLTSGQGDHSQQQEIKSCRSESQDQGTPWRGAEWHLSKA